MGLIDDKKIVVKSVKYVLGLKIDDSKNALHKEQLENYAIDDFKAGVSFAETEFQSIMLNLVQSIFDYERESLEMINSYDRTPESVLEQFIIKYKTT